MIGTVLLVFITVFIFMKLFNSFGNSKYNNESITRESMTQESEKKMKTALNLEQPQNPIVQSTIQPVDNSFANDIIMIKNRFENFVPEIFLKQAEQIFDKVFNAFVDSQHQILKESLSEKLYENFAVQIKKRDDKNLRQEMTIEHLKTSLKKIYISSDVIQLLVSFEVSQVVAMVDINGNSLDNPNKIARKVQHAWLFESSKSNNELKWIIVKTSSNELR